MLSSSNVVEKRHQGHNFSAGIQHARQCRLLSRRDGQGVRVFDLNPAPSVDAVERRQGRLPLVRTPVSLGLVDVVGDGPQLRRIDIVGEGLPLGRRPSVRARLKQNQHGWVKNDKCGNR